MNSLAKADYLCCAQHICPAPQRSELFPPTVDGIQGLLQSEPENPDLLFSLGNLHLRAGRFVDAIRAYRQALQKDSFNAGIWCNLGITLVAMGNEASGERKLLRSLNINPKIVPSYYCLCQVHERRGDFQAVLSYAQRLIEVEPGNVIGAEMAAKASEQLGVAEQAAMYFSRLFEIQPRHRLAREKLCELAFQKGKQLLESGKVIEGFVLWHESHLLYEPAYTTSKRLADSLKQLREDYNRKRRLRFAIRAFEQAYRTAHFAESVHQLTSEYLFSIGLIPEHFIKLSDLAQQKLQWEASLEARGEHPFARFKLALNGAYRGEFQAALDLAQRCADKLPPKKHEALRLKSLLSFLKRMASRLEHLEADKTTSIIAEDWARFGFNNAFETEAWKRETFAPDLASVWKALGFSPKQARAWHGEGITAEAARNWIDSGIDDPKRAGRFTRAGVGVQEAIEWTKGFDDSQIVQWKNAGFVAPELAKDWAKHFMFAWEARQWYDLGFSADEAGQYMSDGEKDPFVAVKLKTSMQ